MFLSSALRVGWVVLLEQHCGAGGGYRGRHSRTLVCHKQPRLLHLPWVGQFFYPNGSVVPVTNVEHSLYSNSGDQLIHLNRRNDDVILTLGTYRCTILDANAVNQNLYITLGMVDSDGVL